MPQLAAIFFYASLNDFLRRHQQQKWIPYSFQTPSSVKDAIEAIGVPHVEVEKLVVNGIKKDFSYLLQNGDQIEVFPFENSFPEHFPQSFVLDVHLGKLARLLRMLGIDAFYQNHLLDNEIVAIAVAENRAVLTRDIGLLKHKVLKYGHWLRSQNAEEQLLAVIRRFALCSTIQPFTRCIACNGLLQIVDKSAIQHLLPQQTREIFDVFYQCRHCGKVYWKGSHYENMQRLIQRITSLAC